MAKSNLWEKAKSLGTTIEQLKCLHPSNSAREILAKWDYKNQKLNVGQAREIIASCRPVRFHYTPGPENSRYPRLASAMRDVRRFHDEFVARLSSVPTFYGQGLDWRNDRTIIQVGDRRILVIRSESASWDNPNSRWPSSRSTSYTSYLLRSEITQPACVENLRNNKVLRWSNYGQIPLVEESDGSGWYVEQSISHDARGHWWKRVISRFGLSEDYQLPDPPAERTFKVLEQNGALRSVFNHEVTYQLGEWKSELAKPDHGGGFYCYRDIEACRTATLGNSIFGDGLADGKTLVLCECKSRGPWIEYQNGKLSCSEICIERIVAELNS